MVRKWFADKPKLNPTHNLHDMTICYQNEMHPTNSPILDIPRPTSYNSL